MSIVKSIKNLLSVRLALLCCLVGTAGLAQAENKVYIEDFGIQVGETKTIALNLNTELDLKSLEGNIMLPAGLEVQNQGSESSKLWIKYDNTRVKIAAAQFNPTNGKVKITGFGALISSGTGPVANIIVKATSELVGGSVITLSDFSGTDKNGNVVEIASEDATVSNSIPVVSITPATPCLLPGGTAQVEVQLENGIELTGLQGTVQISEGLILAGTPEQSERLDGALMPNPKTMTLFFLGTIAPGNGTILTVPIGANEGFQGGSIKLTGLVATTSSSAAIHLDDVEVNVAFGDGIIVISKDGGKTNVSVDETKGTPKSGIISSGLAADNVDYQRTLGSGIYTVCLPFAPATEGLKFYELSGAEGETLTFSEVVSPQAEIPYLVTAETETALNKTATSVTMKQVTNGKSAGKYAMKGTMTGLTNAEAAAAGAYILQAGGEWKKVTTANADAYIPPFRAYIVAAGSEARLNTVIGETTAIENLRTVDIDGTEHWYDLNGRSIAGSAKKGVYIVNGKKLLK